MQTPQAGCVAHRRAQDPRCRWQRERLSGKRSTISFEMLWSQSHQAPTARAGRPLMEPLAAAVKYQVACLQFHAAPKHRRARARRKPYKYEGRIQ
jgi:hypothetical protein